MEEEREKMRQEIRDKVSTQFHAFMQVKIPRAFFTILS